MYISFARGDSYEKGFVLRDKRTKDFIITDFDEVYFTVKKRYTDKEPVLQKRMSENGIVNDGLGHYTVFIKPEDTEGLPFGEYDFDISLKKDENFVRTFVGTLELTKEVTHKSNE